MRLKQIDIKEVPPVEQFSVTDLSNVVVLAGPNGVGKTRLIQWILQAFQSGGVYPNTRLIIEATTISERSIWGKESLDTSLPVDAQKLATTLQKNQRRSKWESSVIQFESDRTVQQIQPFQFTWDITDPWEELIGWNYSFSALKVGFKVLYIPFSERCRADEMK